MDATLAWEDITPEIAQEYLSKNIDNNRNPMSDRVAKLARDMRSKNWVPTADPIKFNTQGKLIDGQHRLRAIMLSKVTTRLLVARDVPDDAVLVVDTGSARTTAQTLKIFDSTVKNRSTVVAIAQIDAAYRRGVFRTTASSFNARERMSSMEAIQYITDHEEVLENAATISMSIASHFPIPQSIIGAAFMILSRVDYDDAVEFFNGIREGHSGRGADDPVATLSRRIYTDKINGRKISHATALYFIIRTWNAWRAHEQLQKLQVGSSTQGYTNIPTPK